uniref:Uncharacterized protein n=1 Tax=Varanus komodoensis TaxID=61221 RepID=A0A8D2LBE7_VARKO
MDASVLLGRLSKEALCSLCQEYFKDPVCLHCGHNFCQACVTQRWGELEANVSCPQCGESGQRKSSRENQHLARIVEIVKCLNLDALEDGRACERHAELLKVFCKEDQTPICLVCSLSSEHRRHTVIPMEEAAQEYKEQFQMELQTWKQRRETLQALKLAEEGRSRKSLEKLDNEGKKIVSEFERLHQFLDNQEELLLGKLEELEKDVIKEEKTITSWLSREISSLSDLLSEIEEKHKQPMSKFLQVRTWVFPLRNQEVSQLGKWLNGMKLPPKAETELFLTNGEKWNHYVTLDPDTANPFLVLSADQRSIDLTRTPACWAARDSRQGGTTGRWRWAAGNSGQWALPRSLSTGRECSPLVLRNTSGLCNNTGITSRRSPTP